jgi:DNA-binding MarR family transcriptional regulator
MQSCLHSNHLGCRMDVRSVEPGGEDNRAGPGEDAGAGRIGETHPTASLSEIVHQRHRLGILTITSRARQADFGYLQEALGLTSGNLSTHVTVLEDAGLVRTERGYQGRRARTWVSITGAGRAALAAEIAALAALVREQDEGLDTEHAGGGHERDT